MSFKGLIELLGRGVRFRRSRSSPYIGLRANPNVDPIGDIYFSLPIELPPSGTQFLTTDSNGNMGISPSSGGGGGGVSDHGLLTGLDGDDHPQYFNTVRADARYYRIGQLVADLDIPGSIARDTEVTNAIASHAATNDHPIATTAAKGMLSSADKTKLDGIATGATANSTDTELRDRATHTGTQSSSTISDFSEAVDDRVGSLLVAGANVTLTYSDAGNSLTIASAGAGGGGGEVNTASNVGVGGVSVFKQKTGVNLEFRSINSASGKLAVVLDAANNEIDIDLGTVAIADITGLQAALGAKVETSALPELVDDRVASLLVAGSGVSLVYNDTANTFTISATGGGGGITQAQAAGLAIALG